MGAPFLQDLVIVTVAAAAVTVLFSRLKQPLVIGYLLAGLLIGPHLLPSGFLNDVGRVEELAELGLIFLMFALGLEFNLSKLRRHGLVALFIAAVEVVGMMAVGYGVGVLLGWSLLQSLFLGAIIASTSTTILVKALLELGLIQEEFAEVTIGVTILEDLIVLVIALVLQSNAEGAGMDLAAVGMLLLQLGLFLAITVSVGIIGVPRFVEWVSRHSVDEVLVITVVGLAFAGALTAASLGFSLSLGAFLVGGIIAESRVVRKVESRIVPIRDLFSSLFFVAVGMLLDPAVVIAEGWLVLVVAGAALLGKLVANWAGAMLAGYEGATSLKIGLAMAQMGEWSLIVAAVGLSLGAIPEALYSATVAACSITMLIAPFLLRGAGTIADRAAGLVPSAAAEGGKAYRSLLQRVGGAWSLNQDSRLKTRTLPHKVNLLLFGTWVFGLFLAGAALFTSLEERFGPLLPLDDEVRRGVSLAVFALLGLPLFLAFARAVYGWYSIRSRHVTLRPRSLVRSNRSSVPGRVIAVLVAATAAVALSAASVAVAAITIHPFVLPGWPTSLAVALFLGVVTALLWRRLGVSTEWLEGTITDYLAPPHRRGVNAYLQRIRDRCPWGVEAAEAVVGSSSRTPGLRLSDVSVRARTGAVVVARLQGNGGVPVRPGEFVGLPGERVVLVGSRRQVEQARALLSGAEDLRSPEPAALARG